MEKIITFARVLAGDTIRTELSTEPLSVLAVTWGAYSGAPIRLRIHGTGRISRYGRPDTPVILVHRQWPDGTSDIHARSTLTDKLANIVGRAAAIGKPMNPQEIREAREAREALDAYELGKPESQVQGVSSDPAEAAVDASCGYLGGGPVGC